MLYDPKQQRIAEHLDRKVSADLERLREREMERLARDLAPPKQGGGFPWLLLLLGAGGGGAWWALQDADPGGGPQNGELGAADVTGILAD